MTSHKIRQLLAYLCVVLAAVGASYYITRNRTDDLHTAFVARCHAGNDGRVALATQLYVIRQLLNLHVRLHDLPVAEVVRLRAQLMSVQPPNRDRDCDGIPDATP